MKNGKRPGISDLTNEMLKYGINEILLEYLTIIFEKIFTFSIVPYHFNIAIVKLIIKDSSKSTNEISNLRPISISDCLSNLLEQISLNEIYKSYSTNSKQFGFKKNNSCSHAVFVVQQAIINNLKLNKSTHMTAIDASQAFDKIHRQNLWNIMLKKPINKYVIKTLIEYYDNSYSIIENPNAGMSNDETEYSKLFKTTVGLKQGGSASAYLFTIYVDNLIDKIERSGSGMNIGNLKIEILLYADDIILLSQSKQEMQTLLDNVSSFGKENYIKFNPEKTLHILYKVKSRILKASWL